MSAAWLALPFIVGSDLLFFALDYYISVQGLKQGTAEEGNWIVRKVYGGKPNALQLLAGLLPQELSLLGIAGAALFINPGFGVGLGTTMMVNHIRRIRAWENLGTKF